MIVTFQCGEKNATNVNDAGDNNNNPKMLPIIDSVALLVILNGADLFVDSGTLLFSSSTALFIILGLLNSGALLLGHLATVWAVAHTALGV